MPGDRQIDHIEDDLTHAPCIKFDPVFKIKDVDSAKIQVDYADGRPSGKTTCFVYTTEYGAELFIIVKKKFQREMQALGATAGDYWNSWTKCLDMTAFAMWDSQTQGIGNAQRTIARWRRECATFLRVNATANGRDYLYAYLRHPKYKKPHDVTVEKWNARTDALLDYAGEMEGTSAELDDEGRKQIKFDSYDANWKSQFALSKNYATTSEAEMIQWFKDKKLDADKNEKKRKRQTIARGGGRSSNWRGRRPTGRGYMGGRLISSNPSSYYPSQYQGRGYFGNNYRGGFSSGRGRSFGQRSFGNRNFGNRGRGYFGRNPNSNWRGGRSGGYQQQGRAPQLNQGGRDAYQFQGRGPAREQRGRAANSAAHAQYQQQQEHYMMEEQEQYFVGDHPEPTTFENAYDVDFGPTREYYEYENDYGNGEYYDDGSGDAYYGQGW